MIVFEDVTKIYDPDVVGLLDFTCHIGKGEFVFLVGPSGSGKSTLIKLVLKELMPEKGRILVAGRNLGTLRGNKVPLLRRNIGCVFQDFKLLPNRPSSTTSPMPSRSSGSRDARSAAKCPRSSAWSASPTRPTATRTRSAAANSSACL